MEHFLSAQMLFIGKAETYSGSSLYNETHEHILQLKKAEIKSELTENAPF